MRDRPVLVTTRAIPVVARGYAGAHDSGAARAYSDGVTELPPAIPAATLVLFREREGGPPELLMVERARAMAFAGGALVFPGGRIDPGDRTLAATLDGDPEDMAARIAAIRETIEEVGIAIGVSPLPDEAALAAMRVGLHDGATIGAVLAGQGRTLDPATLIPFARWRPAHEHARIFDTLFYIARLPPGAPDPRVDDTENVRVQWTSAQAVLDATDRGEARIIFPTRRNLERLALHANFAEAADDAARHPIRAITPWEELRDGVAHLCIPEDLGYPVTAERLTRATRG